MPKILVSACLLGQKVRYDAKDCLQNHARLQEWIDAGNVIAVCPEMSGGLPTPRAPAEIQDSKTGIDVLQNKAEIKTSENHNVTRQYIEGAYKALKLAQENSINVAILKARSPSCGSQEIYDGTFSRTLISGMGVTAALLSQYGIKIFDEYYIDEALDLALKYNR